MISISAPPLSNNETDRCRVLAKVYALLIQLADSEKQTVDSGNLGGETLPTAGQKASSTGLESVYD